MSDRIAFTVPQNVKARVHGLYGPMKKRLGPKYWKRGKREGQLRDPGQELPFSEPELLEWMWEKIGTRAQPCPFCGRPIDILSASLDHDVPVSRGGSVGLNNLVLCCPICNRTKGALTGAEFRAFMAFVLKMDVPAQYDIIGRLKAGAMGMRMRYYSRLT